MLTTEQVQTLKDLGYSVVASDRNLVDSSVNTYSVRYPKYRPDAVSGRYSQETFVEKDMAWEEAWRDYEAGNHLQVHSRPPEPGFVLDWHGVPRGWTLI